MKILIFSHHFYPSLGGIERTSEILANGLASRGNQVKVITSTHANANIEELQSKYAVARNPSMISTFRDALGADVILHNGISLRSYFIHVITLTPWVVVVHIWLRRNNDSIGMRDRLKQIVIGQANAAISVSPAIADHLYHPSRVIGNSYLEDVFFDLHKPREVLTLVAVGRLIPAKGFDVLIRAIDMVRKRGIAVSLNIVGEGSALTALRQLVIDLELSSSINFLGVLEGADLNKLLNASEILVIPSRWEEPFGIVALEGLAAGCIVLGTDGGGLPFAIGPCGPVARRGDEVDLANKIESLLKNENIRNNFRDKSQEHLAMFTTSSLINQYEQILRSVLPR